jgi:hypothetical protein
MVKITEKWSYKLHSSTSWGFLLLISATLIVYMAVPVFASLNLLENPGFETGALTPWEVYGIFGWGYAREEPGHTGAYYWSIESDRGSVWILQEVDPPSCAMYLEFWYRNGTGGVMEVCVNYTDGSRQCQEFYESDEWTLFHMNLDTEKQVEGVEVRLEVADLGLIDLDDFDLKACEPSETAVGGVILPDSSYIIGTAVLTLLSIIGVYTGLTLKKHQPV